MKGKRLNTRLVRGVSCYSSGTQWFCSTICTAPCHHLITTNSPQFIPLYRFLLYNPITYLTILIYFSSSLSFTAPVLLPVSTLLLSHRSSFAAIHLLSSPPGPKIHCFDETLLNGVTLFLFSRSAYCKYYIQPP
jgi:hypothetical protein